MFISIHFLIPRSTWAFINDHIWRTALMRRMNHILRRRTFVCKWSHLKNSIDGKMVGSVTIVVSVNSSANHNALKFVWSWWWLWLLSWWWSCWWWWLMIRQIQKWVPVWWSWPNPQWERSQFCQDQGMLFRPHLLHLPARAINLRLVKMILMHIFNQDFQ